ncbi:hypothetical protein ACFWIW_13995 [Amycolatopsis sp. NPDC058340]|uniref:hypothetical protein n=1 Tax=Amycolatopsis sp. NPDC058340 TaxID=3346453 RepID=UPI003656CB39
MKRSRTMLAAGAAVAASLVLTQPALAAGVPTQSVAIEASAMSIADAKARLQYDCFVGNINNGEHWDIERSDGKGYARWREHEDTLSVYDTDSDGYRTIAILDVCIGGTYERIGRFDSGPNVGDIDIEYYEFNYKEGRKVAFIACRMITELKVDKCSGTQMANA